MGIKNIMAVNRGQSRGGGRSDVRQSMRGSASVCVMILIVSVVQELYNAVAAACSGQGVVVKW